MSRILFGLLCRHKWETVGEGTIKSLIGFDRTKEENWIETGIVVKLRCEHCGDVKMKKTTI